MHATALTRRGTTLPLSAAVLGLAATFLVASPAAALAASPATGSGDPSLSGYVLKHPEPGWTPAPQSVDAEIAGRVETAQNTGTGTPLTDVVDNAWYSPSTNQALAIVLISAPDGGLDRTSLVEVATAECSQAPSSQTPSTIGVASPRGGVAASCETPSYGEVTTVAWFHGGLAAAVIGFGGLASSTVEAAALEQDHALPGGLSPTLRDLFIAAAAAALVLAGLWRFGSRTPRVRERPAPATRAPTGYLSRVPAADLPVPATAVAGSYPTQGVGAAAPYGRPGAGRGAPAAPAPYRSGAGRSAPDAGASYLPGAAVLPPYRPARAVTAPPPPVPAPAYPRARLGVADERWTEDVRERSAGTGAERHPDEAIEPDRLWEPAVAGSADVATARSEDTVGWYAVDGNRYEQAYFDGFEWVARKRWDGERWVDLD